MVDELRALEHSPSFYNPLGSKKKKKTGFKKGSALAGIFGLFFIAVGAIFYGYGNAAPDTIKTNLVEATDIQCANGTIDKEWAFIETLRTGDVPSDTVSYLKQSNILIGRLDENNNFIEDAHGTLLKRGDQLLSGDALFDAFQTDVGLYDAFNNATYSCTAFYYDDAAQTAFSSIGTNRNNLGEDINFEELLNNTNEKSNITIDSATKKTRTVTDENGDQATEVYYEQTGDLINSSGATAEELVDAARIQNPAATETESALNTADVLKVADTASKEQRSSLFFLYFMESIDKMKSGEGDSSNLNDAMNFLTTPTTTQVVDVETGEIIETTGTPLDAPSLNSILSGEPVVAEKSKNYSSDRVIQTVANQLNLEVAETKPVNNVVSSSIGSTISSFTKNISGCISRFITSSAQTVEFSVLSPIIPTISSSLIKGSSTNSIYGIAGGEMLVEGAVNVGRKLAMQGSGATAGDGEAVLGYHEQIKQIAALNAEVERKNLSPFDITSKNTFLGSITSKLLPITTGTNSLTSVVTKSLALLSPSTYADGESTSILTNFGDCSTYSTIGAVGSAHCSLIATFDTSTQHDPYNNPEYLAFVEENTYLDSNGNRQIKDGSYLADFIIFNNNRISPFGTIDPGVLSAKQQGSGILKYFTNIAISVSLYDNASEADKNLASGAAFVNSASNPLWDQYKYAQRYVSINRAVNILREYSTDDLAYQNLKGCEGDINPVVAFTERYFEAHPQTSIAYTVEQKTTHKTTAKYPSATESFDASDYHLVIPEVLNQTLAPSVIKFGEYVVKQNNWTLA